MKFHVTETVSMENNIRFEVKTNVLTLGSSKGSKRKDQDCDFILSLSLPNQMKQNLFAENCGFKNYVCLKYIQVAFRTFFC